MPIALGRGTTGSLGAQPLHLSLLHLWAPLVMVKPPVSSCWMCMARRRAEGSVGWARKRRPSIRHRLSLFRKTWGPSQGCGQGEMGERSVQHAQLPVRVGSSIPPARRLHSTDLHPTHTMPGMTGSGWKVWTSEACRHHGTRTPIGKLDTSRHQKWQTCFLTYSFWAPEKSWVTQLPQGGQDPGCPASGTCFWCQKPVSGPPRESCVCGGSCQASAAVCS